MSIARKNQLAKTFNTNINEFLSAIAEKFPDNMYLQTGIDQVAKTKKLNPILLISMFYTEVALPFERQINERNFDFLSSGELKSYILKRAKDAVGDGTSSTTLVATLSYVEEVLTNCAICMESLEEDDRESYMEQLHTLFTISRQYSRL